MKYVKRIVVTLCIAVAVLAAVFLAGRYGWRLAGFSACRSAMIHEVSVEDGHVQISGAYPGIFSEGFPGYHAEQVGDTLYVGFRFSGLFGVFERGAFDISIPTDGTVARVIIKTKNNEHLLWPSEDDPSPTEEASDK